MLIAQCLIVEIFDIGKHQKPYNHERYLKNLKKLPEEPFEDGAEHQVELDTQLTNNYLPTGIKIGRNDKVTVKYVDGRVEKSIKFKKVKDDLLNGLCDLVE